MDPNRYRVASVQLDHVVPLGGIVLIHRSGILLNPVVPPENLEVDGIATRDHHLVGSGDATEGVGRQVGVTGGRSSSGDLHLCAR